jgi:hypothetical protein
LGLWADGAIFNSSSGYHCIAFASDAFLFVLLWLLGSPHQHYKKQQRCHQGYFVLSASP